MESSHIVFETGRNSTLDLRRTHTVTELKQQLTDLLIYFSSCMEVLLIHSNVRYTRHLSVSNFGLVENCGHLWLMVK